MSDTIKININLLQAAERGNVNAVKLLINEGADVNAQNKHGFTPLHWAAERGHKEMAKILLQANKINVNAEDDEAWTPLHWAAERGHKEMAKILLQANKINVNAEDDEAWTPLHWAAERGHKEMVEILLQANKINVNAKDNEAWTPLHWAAKNGHVEMVNTLLDKGADINAQNKSGWTPLHLAKTEEIKTLLQSVKEANDKLLAAAADGKIDDVKNLFEEGKAQVGAKDKDGWAPLHWAAHNGHVEMVNTLLGKGANVNAQNKHGLTPLHWAAQNGDKDVVEILLNTKNIDVNAQDNSKWTPLYYAVGHGHEGVVKVLLTAKEIDAETYSSALFLAAREGHEGVIKVLSTAIDVETYSSALFLAAREGHEGVIKVLLTAIDVETYSSALSAAAKNGDKAMVGILLKADRIDINALDNDGKTLLHWAAQNGHVEIARLLIEKGANINAVDSFSCSCPIEKTPLHYAAENGHKEMVEILLRADGIDINALDNDGKTPLDLAKTEEIKTLLKAAENNVGSRNESSIDNEGDQEEDAGQEKQEDNAQPGSDVIQDQDIKTEGVQPIAPTESAQTEEQPSSFFGSLFNILTKPFSLVASFVDGLFSRLFESDEPIQSSSELDKTDGLQSDSIEDNDLNLL